MDFLQGLRESLSDVATARLVQSAAIIVVLFVIRWVVVRIIARRTDDIRTLYQARKIASYVTVVIVLVLLGRVWFSGVQSLLTYFGLLSAGVAIALKDPLTGMAGWLFILWRRPFAVGDRIQIGDHAGDVVDVRLFQFTLLEIRNWVDADQSTGRIIHIPNGDVFSKPVANYVRGFRYIWHEIPVLLTFESDWRAAKSILTEVLSEHAETLTPDAERRLQSASRKYMIFYSTLTPIVYTTVRDSGVLLTMRFLCDPRRRRGTEQTMWEAILERFSAYDDIDFAYPTIRHFDHGTEGKPVQAVGVGVLTGEVADG
ncbi:MAG TPA: mechanosensitive ion channel domain-containing protein [Longimicrobiales bacterium]|nr:mechanosensitive ion channel domain-containing protein [Longimicrobiales bacterium]